MCALLNKEQVRVKRFKLKSKTILETSGIIKQAEYLKGQRTNVLGAERV